MLIKACVRGSHGRKAFKGKLNSANFSRWRKKI